MKRFLLFGIILLNSLFSFCIDYSKVDAQSGSVPSNLKTANEIAKYLTRNLTSPFEKTRAIYFWISNNIYYDMAQINSKDNTYSDPQELVNDVLLKRKGVCAHYAELFNACCRSVGLESYVIMGYTITDHKVATLAHAWNAVRIDSKFYNFDATWASGSLINGKFKHYFNDQFCLISPSDFIKTHIPFDPIWQFLDNPLTCKEIETGDFSKLKIHSNFNYTDSIKKYSESGKLEKLVQENRRMIKYGLTNNLSKDHKVYLQKAIATEKFNIAVSFYNKAVESFNLYVADKNKQFSKKSVDEQSLSSLLSPVRKQIELAEKTIQSVNPDDATIISQIQGLEISIDDMKKSINEEDLFWVKYRNRFKSSRIF